MLSAENMALIGSDVVSLGCLSLLTIISGHLFASWGSLHVVLRWEVSVWGHCMGDAMWESLCFSP